MLSDVLPARRQHCSSASGPQIFVCCIDRTHGITDLRSEAQQIIH